MATPNPPADTVRNHCIRERTVMGIGLGAGLHKDPPTRTSLVLHWEAAGPGLVPSSQVAWEMERQLAGLPGEGRKAEDVAVTACVPVSERAVL